MNITDKIKQAVYESTQQLIKPVYEKIKTTFSTKKELEKVDNVVGQLELRTHIGKELYGGLFGISTTSNFPIIKDEFIKFDTTIESNGLELNEDGTVTLQPYTTYEVIANISSDNGIGNFGIYDNEGNTYGVYGLLYNVSYSDQPQAIARINVNNKLLKIGIKINDGTCTKIEGKNCFLRIQEINRQVILDPAEDAKNLEFIYDKYDAVEQKYSIKTSSKLNIINKDGEKVESIKLLKGIKYEIEWNINSVGLDTNLYYSTNILLINNDTNETISFMGNKYYYGAEQGYDITGKNNNKFAIIPENDINVSLMIEPSGNIKVYNGYLIIKEISHPYYFNYYKDSLSSKVLFEGEANAVGEYQLLDDVSNYEWLEVYGCALYSGAEYISTNSLKIKVSDIVFKDNDSSSKQNFSLIIPYTSDFNNTIIVLDFNNQNHFNILTNRNITTYNKIIHKIEGIGFNYDNPYKDLISSGDNTLELSEEEYNDMITDIKGGDI